MSNTRSMYECVEIQLFSDERVPYTGQGTIKYAKIKLDSSRIVGRGAKTIDLIVNSKGIVNTERKIRKWLVHEGITVPNNLDKTLRQYKK